MNHDSGPGAFLFLRRAYSLLLRLYPPRYYREYSDERITAFDLALADASIEGPAAVLQLALREACDLPFSALRENLRERGKIMADTGLTIEEKPVSWAGFLGGLWLFVFLGPLMSIVPYLPYSTRRLLNYETPLWLAVIYASLVLGVLIGWTRNFPRWSYPYLLTLLYAILGPILSRLTVLLGPARFQTLVSVALLLVSILVIVIILISLGRFLPPFKRIYQDIRADWTRLSFGLFTYVAFVSSFFGGDHQPPFNLWMILSPLVVILGAGIYLLSRSRRMRVFSLLLTAPAAMLLRALGMQQGGPANLIAIPLLIAIIFFPVLEGLLPRRQGGESLGTG